MIITVPTGLYKTILPKEGESGNITYTISTQPPPRPFVNAIQLPTIEEITPSPTKIWGEETRRGQFGELIFTVSQSNKNISGSNIKAFEVGEILEFENLIPVEEIITVRAPENIEIRHDTNLLDLAGLGLTEDEISSLTSQSDAKQRELEVSFADKQNEIKTLEVDITEVQKTTNENEKVLKAVRGLLGLNDSESSDNEIFQKLIQNKTTLQEQTEQLISDRNAAAEEVAEINRQITRISELVR